MQAPGVASQRISHHHSPYLPTSRIAPRPLKISIQITARRSKDWRVSRAIWVINELSFERFCAFDLSIYKPCVATTGCFNDAVYCRGASPEAAVSRSCHPVPPVGPYRYPTGIERLKAETVSGPRRNNPSRLRFRKALRTYSLSEEFY